MNNVISISQPSILQPANLDAMQQVQFESERVPTLKDLLEDGIYLLFLLRSENGPVSIAEFNRRIDQYLATFERVCRTFSKSQDAIIETKYAFCALLDETILSSQLSIRDEWQQSPLQLRLFGEHLAGEIFFSKLEKLREEPTTHIELLEVFHTCLLLGFQGKYLLEGSEKLNYLVARLGQEIAAVRGPDKGFAPHWKIPLKFNEYVRHELPLWLYYALLAIVGVGVFIFLQWMLVTQLNRLPAAFDVAPASGSGLESTPAVDEVKMIDNTAQAQPVEHTPAATTTPKAAEGNRLMERASAAASREAEQEAISAKNAAQYKATSGVRSLFRR
jgi:type VI secretion system protein ImpK